MKREYPEKTMYRVEKFLPLECPKCRYKLERNGRDWSQLLGDMVNGEKVLRPTDGYTIVICKECDNHTARFNLEAYVLADEQAAQKLVDEQGFIGPFPCHAIGNMAQDHHIFYAKPPGGTVSYIHGPPST